MPKTIDELFQLIKQHLLWLAVAPLGFFALLFLERSRKFLIEKILPTISQETTWLLFLLFVYLFSLALAYSYSLKDKIKKQEKETEKIKNDLNAKIQELSASVSLQQSEIESLQKEKAALISENKKKADLLNNVKQAAEEAQKNITNLIAEHDAQVKRLSDFHMGQTQLLANLLNQEMYTVQERHQFLTTLDPRLQTPQVYEELKFITWKVQTLARVTSLMKQSAEQA